MITAYFKRRRAKKIAAEWLQHARLSRNMREDVASPLCIDNLVSAEERLRLASKDGDINRIEKECGLLREATLAVMPVKPKAGLRENIEVVVVALAVAMAFRCYFLQPFKIPTGSMQPSLFGIHYEPLPEPGLFDSHPLRYLKWMVFGEWYVEIKADTAGRVRGPIENGGESIFDIGGLVHRLPHEMNILIKAGDDVVTGQVIARGCRVTGDHLFVNRVKWNFVRPRRGDVMVFRTDNIPALDAKKTHYIKRLSGLPNETIGIVPPNLIVDGKAVVDDARIRTIAIREPGYFGYTLAFGVGADYIYSTNSVVKLKRNQYLGLGDNTRNSLDSRYWGPVPQDNLVGPACLVYWPISRRTGFVR